MTSGAPPRTKRSTRRRTGGRSGWSNICLGGETGTHGLVLDAIIMEASGGDTDRIQAFDTLPRRRRRRRRNASSLPDKKNKIRLK